LYGRGYLNHQSSHIIIQIIHHIIWHRHRESILIIDMTFCQGHLQQGPLVESGSFFRGRAILVCRQEHGGSPWRITRSWFHLLAYSLLMGAVHSSNRAHFPWAEIEPAAAIVSFWRRMLYLLLSCRWNSGASQYTSVWEAERRYRFSEIRLCWYSSFALDVVVSWWCC
jgi:hypothetical protein